MAKDKGLKLFGVRIEAPPIEVEEEVVEEGMRKSYSMVNLASCEAHQSEDKGSRDHGYVSDGGLLKNSKRKRGVPWTEEEHKTFLSGLKTLGKGDWRGISRNYVTTRTPTQVASHAQKYFLRQTNPNKKKRRSSLFDVAINDNATPNHKETPIELFSKTVDAAESRDNHLVCAPSVAREAEASQSLTLATINFDATSLDFYSKPATPSIEHSDLELSIAPPRPHRIGAISVT